MGIPASIRDLLEREQAHYQVLPHRKTLTLTQAAEACDLALGQLVRAVILVDGKGLLMAVLPADHVIDFDTLCRHLHRDLELVPGNRLNTIFNDCEPGSYPPLAPAYNLDVVLDAGLLRAAPQLKLVCLTATGFNNVDIEAERDLGIAVGNLEQADR